MNKTGLLALISVLLLSAFIPTQVSATPAIPNPYTLTAAIVGGPRSLDPHWSYDTLGGSIIMQVYETLIDYKGGRTDEFVPELADSWTISSDGLTYTFHIRGDVKFSDDTLLTPADVEYSFERGMVRDRSGGPMWMLYESLIGVYGSRYYPGWPDSSAVAELGQKIDNALTSNATHVQFHLAAPYSPFIHILTQAWSSVLSKTYMTRMVTFPGGATDSFDFPGFGVTGYDGWLTYNNYQREVLAAYFGYKVSPLDSPPQMLGTGPFKFVEWIKGEGGHRTLNRNKDYWGGWPAGATGTARAGQFAPSRGYIDTFIEYQITSWSTRRDGFLAGTYDWVYVPKESMSEVWQKPDIRCIYPPRSLSFMALCFNFDISTVITTEWGSYPNPYLGVPGGLPPGTFNETGIPPEFFNDTDLRIGFAYSFNASKFIWDRYYGEAVQPATPVIEGLPYRNPAQEKYAINLAKAEEHLKIAWNGQVWTNGFTLTVIYDSLASWIGKAWEILKANVESLNPKFHIKIEPIYMWLDTPIPTIPYYETMFLGGWFADYPDPHNFIHTYMHTNGEWSMWQSYSNPKVDALIEEELETTNTARRQEIFYELQQIYHNEVPSAPIAQTLGRHWERDWVQGWCHNPALPGANLYTVWKEELPWEDVDTNGKIEIKDIAAAAKAYGAYYIQPLLPPYPSGLPGYYTPNWDSRCDIDQNMKVEIRDLAKIALKFSYAAPPWTPPPDP